MTSTRHPHGAPDLDLATSLTFAYGPQREALTGHLRWQTVGAKRQRQSFEACDVSKAMDMASEALRCQRLLLSQKGEQCDLLHQQLQQGKEAISALQSRIAATSIDSTRIQKENRLRASHRL